MKFLQILVDALIEVILMRNGVSDMIMFVYTPWIEGLGIQNTFYLRGNDLPRNDCHAYPITYLGKKLKGTNGDKI